MADRPLGKLTNREKEILRLKKRKKTNAEIAQELGLTIGTVKGYLTTAFRKMHTHNAREAIERAEKDGQI